jgi:hypothetical protein
VTKANVFHPQQHNEVFANGSMYVPTPQTFGVVAHSTNMNKMDGKSSNVIVSMP